MFSLSWLRERVGVGLVWVVGRERSERFLGIFRWLVGWDLGGLADVGGGRDLEMVFRVLV